MKGQDIVILAGGKGTRLRGLFPSLPKILVPIQGRPFLEFLLDQVRPLGRVRLVLALGTHASAVVKYVQGRNWEDVETDWVVEETARGTGGALREALPRLRSDPVMVLNGDTLIKFDLKRLVEFHEKQRAGVSVLLTWSEDRSRYGEVVTGRGGGVTAWKEKPKEGGSGYVYAGVSMIERRRIEEIPAGREVSLEREVFPLWVGRSFYALQCRAPFLDIGTPDAFRQADSFVSRQF